MRLVQPALPPPSTSSPSPCYPPQSASTWPVPALLPQRCYWFGDLGKAQRGSHRWPTHLRSSCTHRRLPAVPGAPGWGSVWAGWVTSLLPPNSPEGPLQEKGQGGQGVTRTGVAWAPPEASSCRDTEIRPRSYAMSKSERGPPCKPAGGRGQEKQ